MGRSSVLRDSVLSVIGLRLDRSGLNRRIWLVHGVSTRRGDGRASELNSESARAVSGGERCVRDLWLLRRQRHFYSEIHVSSRIWFDFLVFFMIWWVYVAFWSMKWIRLMEVVVPRMEIQRDKQLDYLMKGLRQLGPQFSSLDAK